MKKINPHYILEKGQPQRTEIIALMLRQHGFEEAKKTGGSHTHFKHADSGVTVGIVQETDKIVYQKEAAKACLEVEEWKAENQRARINELSGQFSETTQLKETEAGPAIDILSGNVDVLEINGTTIVRSGKHSQIGVVCPEIISKSQAERIELAINEQVIDLSEKLNEMQRSLEYDLLESYDGSILTLTHSVYGEEFDFDLGPYDPSQEDALSVLRQAKDNVKKMDGEVLAWSEGVTGLIDPSKPPPDELSNGNLSWKIPLKHFISGEEVIIPLETTPQKRLPVEDLYAFSQKVLEFERGGANDTKRLKKILKETLGVELTISRVDRSQMVAHHPYEKYPIFTIPKVYDEPSITELYDQIMQTDDEESSLKLLDDIFEITASWEEHKIRIVEELDALIERQNQDISRYKDIMSQYPSLQMSVGKQAPGKGNAGFNYVNHPNFPSAVRIDYISKGVVRDTSFNAPTGQGISMIIKPGDLDKLEDMIEVHLKAKSTMSSDIGFDPFL